MWIFITVGVFFGKEVTACEKEWALYIETKYFVGLLIGLATLWISHRRLNIDVGDEAVVCLNAYIVCVIGIAINGVYKGTRIGTVIYYLIPLYLSETYTCLGYKQGDFPISEQYSDVTWILPIYNGMVFEEQSDVINAVNAF